MSTAGFLYYSNAAVQQQEKQRQSLRLDPYVSHRGSLVVVLPAANLRGPPDKYGMLTVASVCTLWLCAPGLVLCSSMLRVSQVAKALKAGGSRWQV